MARTGARAPSPARRTAVDLPALDREVLDALCRTYVTRNAVVLAQELWYNRGSVKGFDPYGLVKDCLEHLNQLGLIRYYAGDRDVPVDIRVTERGYHAAGYDLFVHVAGPGDWRVKRFRRDDASVRHPGDRTDFRTFDDVATGGPIERMPLALHLIKYPNHASIHPSVVATPETREEPMATAAPAPTRRAGTGASLTPGQREQIATMLRAGASNKAILEATGVRDKSIYAEIGRAIGVFRGPAGRILTAEEYEAFRAKIPGGHKLDDAAKAELVREYEAEPTVTAEDLAKRFGVTGPTVRYHLEKAGVAIRPAVGKAGSGAKPRTNGAAPVAAPAVAPEATGGPVAETQKLALLRRLLRTAQPIANLGELMARTRQWPEVSLSEHDLAKAMFDLQKQGFVSQVRTSQLGPRRIKSIRTTGRAEAFLRKIDSPAVAQNERPAPRPRATVKPASEPTPALVPQEPPAPAQPDVVVVAFPLLTELRDRVAAQASDRAQAQAYLDAASLLEPFGKDQPMVDALIGAAGAIAEKTKLTPLEAEYLAFATAVGYGADAGYSKD